MNFNEVRKDINELKTKIGTYHTLPYITEDFQKSGLYSTNISLIMVSIDNEMYSNFSLMLTCVDQTIKKDIMYVFLHYIYYYSCQKPYHFDLIKNFVDNIPHNLKVKTYKDLHKKIIKHFKVNTFIDDGYSSFTYAIIKDHNHELTYQLVDLLINNKYTITNKDINVTKCIMYDYISDTMNNSLIFFTLFDLLIDIKTVIYNILLQSILYDKAPHYSQVYNKLIDYYY